MRGVLMMTYNFDPERWHEDGDPAGLRKRALPEQDRIRRRQ